MPRSTELPEWVYELRRELTTNTSQLVAAPVHQPVMDALRQHEPRKARNVNSALHFVLAQYEYRAISAAAQYGSALGLILNDDQWDGCLWLEHSFPNHLTRAAVFQAMTAEIQKATGIEGLSIREKVILPWTTGVEAALRAATPTAVSEGAEEARAHGEKVGELLARAFGIAVEQLADISPVDIVRVRSVCTCMRRKSTYETLQQLVQIQDIPTAPPTVPDLHPAWLPRTRSTAAHGSDQQLTAQELFHQARRSHAQLEYIRAVSDAVGHTSACVVAGSFALHRLMRREAASGRGSPPHWEPADLDVFVQTREAYEAAVCLAKRDLAQALGYREVRRQKARLRYGEENVPDPAPDLPPLERNHSIPRGEILASTQDDHQWDGLTSHGWSQFVPIARECALPPARESETDDAVYSVQTGHDFCQSETHYAHDSSLRATQIRDALDLALPATDDMSQPRLYKIISSEKIILQPSALDDAGSNPVVCPPVVINIVRICRKHDDPLEEELLTAEDIVFRHEAVRRRHERRSGPEVPIPLQS
eukprot:COSAG01_NODE_4727_length_4789_cov_2.948188_3_plen_537_part_00